jgi:hypothetical protein
VALVCDYLTAGRDNYAANRAEADRLLEIVAQLRDLIQGNRAFIDRAVTWAARHGVARHLDLSTGLLARPSTRWPGPSSRTPGAPMSTAT